VSSSHRLPRRRAPLARPQKSTALSRLQRMPLSNRFCVQAWAASPLRLRRIPRP
jgi:hypothetical protein